MLSHVIWLRVGKTRFLRFGFIGKVLFKNLITAEVQKLGFFKEFYLLSPKFDNNTRDKKIMQKLVHNTGYLMALNNPHSSRLE